MTELYQAVKKGEGDSYGQLAAGQSILEYTENALRKNRAALKKAYFGRIDYEDYTYGLTESRYIGKNGVTRNSDDVVIVDWRAPVSGVDLMKTSSAKEATTCRAAAPWTST